MNFSRSLHEPMVFRESPRGFLPHFFTSAGLLNEKQPVPTAFFHGQDGLIMSSPFMIVLKSVPVCLLALRRRRVSSLLIYRITELIQLVVPRRPQRAV